MRYTISFLGFLLLLSGCQGLKPDTITGASPELIRFQKPGVLWRVVAPESSVYVFGTIHIGAENAPEFSPEMQKVMADSKYLITELSPEEYEKVNGLLRPEDLVLPADKDLFSLIGDDLKEKLSRVMPESQAVPAQFARFQPWAISITLMNSLYGAAGLRPETGTDLALIAEFQHEKKPCYGVETAQYQMTMLRDLLGSGLAEQVDVLGALLNSWDEGIATVKDMYAAYLRGESFALQKLIEDDGKRDAASMQEKDDTYMAERNRGMADRIIAELAKPGTGLFAVGSAHLLGKGSVIELLETAGYHVERL